MEKNYQELKWKIRLDINLNLLMIALTIFSIIISLNPRILQNSLALSLELITSIPCLLSSIFARSKLTYTKIPHIWEKYGYYTFLLGYAFLLNSIWILLAQTVNTLSCVIFFVGVFIFSGIYAYLSTKEPKSNIKLRIYKEAFFAMILIVGWILPVII